MTNKETNNLLYEKANSEQEKYRDWLLKQPPEEILRHCHEYTIREDILYSLENNALSDKQASALLDSKDIISEIYQEYDKYESDHMYEILSCIESRANTLAYIASARANKMCRTAVESAISENYSDNTLNVECADKLIDKFGFDRLKFVLAATVFAKNHDGRFSNDNKRWANDIIKNTDLDDISSLVIDKINPGLVDVFINKIRKSEKEQIPSVVEKIRTAKENLPPVNKTDKKKDSQVI